MVLNDIILSLKEEDYRRSEAIHACLNRNTDFLAPTPLWQATYLLELTERVPPQNY